MCSSDGASSTDSDDLSDAEMKEAIVIREEIMKTGMYFA